MVPFGNQPLTTESGRGSATPNFVMYSHAVLSLSVIELSLLPPTHRE